MDVSQSYDAEWVGAGDVDDIIISSIALHESTLGRERSPCPKLIIVDVAPPATDCFST